MTPTKLRSKGTLRRVALGVCTAACVTAGGVAVGDPRNGAPEHLLRIASDEPLTVRLLASVPRWRVGSHSFRITRDSDDTPARGRYVAGRFTIDRDNGRAAVVDPEGCIQAVQAASGVDRDVATRLVERMLSRYAQSGRRRDLGLLRDATRDLLESVDDGRVYQPLIVVDGAYRGRSTLAQVSAEDPEGRRALRKAQSGDDALWERYLLENDSSAFVELSRDANVPRFHHAADPVTGEPLAESDFRRRETRRCLIANDRTGRVFTFVADVPETPQLADAAFASNARYTVTFAGLPATTRALLTSSGFCAAIRNRSAHLETTNPDRVFPGAYGQTLPLPVFQVSELTGAELNLIDVTPPNGERLVDPTTDWESPDNRYLVPASERKPFVARVRFNQPLDPRTVSPSTFTLTLRRTAVGTANERFVQLAVPVDVRLNQSRLGEVEVEIAPRAELDPSAEFELRVRNLVRALSGRQITTDLIDVFTTAPFAQQHEAIHDDFADPGSQWIEPDSTNPRVLVAADAAHDPDGRGLFVPFLGDDPTPVTAIESGWRDIGGLAPRCVVRFDDPATPEVEGTSFHAPAGSSVRLFARSTPEDILYHHHPNPYLASPWVELDPAHPDFVGRSFVQLRIEFTVPPGATPATPDLPYVDLVSLFAVWP